MDKNRLTNFSDGVIAIIITIMVLNLNTPNSMTLSAIYEIYPTLLAYVLSFIYVGLYWANHHHLLYMVKTVSGRLLWRNLHWIFWMSLIPNASAWMGVNPFKSIPTAAYAIILFMCSLSYYLLQSEIIKISSIDSDTSEKLARGKKSKLSILAYAISIITAFFIPLLSYLVFIGVAIYWIVPDPRIENELKENQ